MCDICGLFFCEPQCPSYDGRDPLYGIPVGECAVCERMIRADEEFFADRSLLLCAACLDKRDGLAGLKKYRPTIIPKDHGIPHVRKENDDRRNG